MSTPHPASGHRRRSTRPTMISHPLAYVASNPRHLAPTVGRGAPSTGDLFWTGTLFLPGERFLRRSLIRLAHEEAERSRRVPHEVPMTQAMTTKGARRAPARAVSSLSSLVQRGQAQARGSSKGTHFGATIPRPAPRQGGSHCGAQAGIITRTFGRGRPTLVRISVPDVPLQIGQLLEPFPLKYLGRGPGPLPIYRD